MANEELKRNLAVETAEKVGKKVKLYGWVKAVRDHGKVTFVDLRDRSGVVQCVANKLPKLTPESVIEVVGKVIKRPKGLINPKLETGKVEVQIESLKILATAEELPLPIDGEGLDIEESVRLKYRYLDLRRPRLQKNLKLRHQVENFVRSWMSEKGFIEIETPYISKATPEGSRDFLVPSRLQPGKFYALPQAPQQYKQLLMVAGFEKYFQIARVFRDEDPRADRAYGEYTQIDIEMSFVSQDEILKLVESLITDLVEQMIGKKLYKKPFPRIPYSEAIKKYGEDRFDMRKKRDSNLLAFAWVVDFPLFEKTETKEISPAHNPFTAPKDEDIHLLKNSPLKVRSWQHDLVCNGYEVAGGAVRITDPDLQAKIFEILGHSKGQIKEKFGHLLEAFKYGVPPHGGIALSLERLMMVFANEPNTREVTAFPMTSGGQTSVMDAPSEVDEEQLKELGIKIIKK